MKRFFAILFALALPLSALGQAALMSTSAEEVPAAPGGSVSLVGSVDTSVTSVNNSGSSTVNIDASANYAVVAVNGYDGGVLDDYFSAGSVALGPGATAMTFLGGTGAGDEGSQQIAFFGLASPPTGAAVEIAWDWALLGNLSSGGQILVFSLTGVGTTPLRTQGGDNVTNGDNISLTVTGAATGDLTISVGAAFNSGSIQSETWVGVTQIGETGALVNSTQVHWASGANAVAGIQFDIATLSFNGVGYVTLRP